jgi:hypothetical protein
MDLGDKMVEMVYQATKYNKNKSDKHGEVFTPAHMILRILNHFPPETLQNPNLKWYDPCAGLGQFPAVITKVLMKTLKEWEPNDEKRFVHIVENMLHISEYQPESANVVREIFNAFIPVNLNLFTGDSLTLDTQKQWGVSKFDIVIGNPPYNDEKDSKVKDNVGKTTGAANFYKKFIEKAFELQTEDGITAFILPPGAWRTFEKYGYNVDWVIFNRLDDWGIKKIATQSWVCSKQKRTTQTKHPILNRIWHWEKKNKVNKDGLYSYGFLAGTSNKGKIGFTYLKQTNNPEGRSGSKNINLSRTPLNRANFLFLLKWLGKFADQYQIQTTPFVNILKYEWLEGLDHKITEEDVVKYYQLTPEQIEIIKDPNKDPYKTDFR